MKKLYNIYNNAITMLTKYRELKLTSKQLNFDEFSTIISHDEYIVIYAECDESNIRGKTNNMTIIIAPDSEIASKSADFKKLANKIEAFIVNNDKTNNEKVNNDKVNNEKVNNDKKEVTKDSHKENNVCIISKTPLTSHINKIINTWKSTTYVEDHTYDIFGYDIFLHNSVPKYNIVNIDWFFEQYYLSENHIPQINSKNAEAVWIGARPGSIVEFTRLSINTGYSDGYAICVSERIYNDAEEI